MVGLLLSTRATYRGRMLPFSVMLSYIWLAAAVTADTRRKSICSFTPDWCQRIRVAEAFSWLALYVFLALQRGPASLVLTLVSASSP